MLYVEQLENAGFKNPYDTCVNVHTRNFDFTVCFIEYEDEETLSILVTDDLGREKLKLLNKKYVEALEVVYADELDFKEKEPGENRMFG